MELSVSKERFGRSRRRAAHVLAAALFLSALLPAAARAETAVLQGLDKITARISTFKARVNEPARFGSLEITVRRCHKTPPEEPPESAAFLEIVDVRPDSPEVLLFSGWMFASSPAISALEHPVYDVWVVDCITDEAADQSADQPADQSGAQPASPTGEQPTDLPEVDQFDEEPQTGN
jgi:hypothetical protein